MAGFYERTKVNFYATKKDTGRNDGKTTQSIDLSGFRDVRGFENLYKVNQAGEIYSTYTNRTLKPTVNSHGYLVVTMSDGVKQYKKQVHIVTAEAWIPNPLELPIVNHLDGVTTNPHISNLEWASYSDNTKHAHATGLINKTSDKPVEKLEMYTGIVLASYDSMADAVKDNPKTSVVGISQVCNGKRASHRGFAWRFKEFDKEKAWKTSVLQ